MSTSPRDYDCIFLSYDEPAADYHYSELKKHWPEVKRVHGIKGLDAAHKECARAASTDRFFIIDGDNLINPNFLNQEVPESASAFPNVVYSWGSLNNVNGLFYGNGGVKFWNRETLLNLQTHENALDKQFNVDFCHGVKYQPVDFGASFLWISGSAYQAYRAGFREGFKFCMKDGDCLAPEDFPSAIANTNYSRLLIWCTVGRDIEFGRWAMLGARLGVIAALTEGSPTIDVINDYDNLRERWEKFILTQLDISPFDIEHDSNKDLEIEAELLRSGKNLKEDFGMNLLELQGDSLKFFRQTYVNPSRSPELQF